MDFFKRLQIWTDRFALKKKLRPYYLPILHRLKYRVENRKFRSNSIDLLNRSADALDKLGISFWLDFGTLLGVIRDGALIAHDTDIDVGVFLSDHTPAIRSVLEEYGFVFKHSFAVEGNIGLEESYTYKGVSFDIFYYTRDDEKMWCHLFPVDPDQGRTVLELRMAWSGFRQVEFAGRQWNVPKDAAQRLIDTYGEGYLEPNPHWNTLRDAQNATLLNKKIKIEYSDDQRK